MNGLINTETIKSLYQKHRKCLVNKNGNICEIVEASKMTLGFDKAEKCVEFSDIRMGQNVMNIFSGAGGILRLLSIRHNVNLLIGLDILYNGLLPSKTDWFYAVDETFYDWKKDIEQIGLSFKWPLFLQSDTREIVEGFCNTMDRIIIDPPYGLVSNTVLGFTEIEAKNTYLASLVTSLNYLVRGGKVTAIIPASWLTDTQSVTSLMEFGTIIEDVWEIKGRKYEFAIVRVRKEI